MAQLIVAAGTREEPVDQSLEVETGSADDEWQGPPFFDPPDRGQRLPDEIGGGELLFRRSDIEKMVRHELSHLGRRFVGADVETAVNLHRIAGDDLAPEPQGQVHTGSALAHACRTQDDDQPSFSR